MIRSQAPRGEHSGSSQAGSGTRAATVVIAVGNVALSDEGLASAVLRQLNGRTPPHVDLIDAGLPGPNLLGLLEGRQKAVIIDAVDAGQPPGTVFRFLPSDASPANPHPRHSLHQGDLLLYINLAQTLNIAPNDIVIIGIQPANISPGQTLSPPVREALPLAAEQVLSELSI